MDCKETKELMGLYVVGALALQESRDLEGHLRDCPTCKVERAAAEEVYALLPFALDGPAPPASSLRSLMARLEEEEKALSRTQGHGLGFLLRPAFAYSLLALAVVVMSLIGIQHEKKLTRQIAAARGEIEFLRLQTKGAQSQLALIQSPDTTVLTLAGQAVRPEAFGKVFWSKSKKVWLVYTSQLPPPPSGKAYELWFLTKKAPVRAGMFTSDAQGNGFVQVSIPEGIEPVNAAISLEPEQGVNSPTGAIYLAGS